MSVECFKSGTETKTRQSSLCAEDETVVVDIRGSMKMRLVTRLEQWTLYPMIFLWVTAFIVGFYDVYLYLENNL